MSARQLTWVAAMVVAAGCSGGEPNVSSAEPEPPMEMTPSFAEDPDLANQAAAAEAEDAAIGGSVSGNDTAVNAQN